VDVLDAREIQYASQSLLRKAGLAREWQFADVHDCLDVVLSE